MVYECKLHYLSFGVIAQGIEFLGACLDELDWDAKNQGESRFNKAIKELFKSSNNEYIKYTSSTSGHYLYEGLRCGLIHMMRPQKSIWLTHREESLKDGTSHLGKKDEKLFLVVEDLYDDFKKACEKIIYKIEHNKITNTKIKDSYITILDLSKQDQQEV
jgi:hypothetical protein